MVERYLTGSEFAARIGITAGAMRNYKLPYPDAVTGRVRGWLPETIDAWNAARPGRGNHRNRPVIESKEPVVYLTNAGVAERIGVTAKSIRSYTLPEPDAVTGRVRGWLPETVDAWNAARPGKGNRGAKSRKD